MKYYKNNLVAAILVFISQSSKAQFSLGFEAGLSRNTIHTNISALSSSAVNMQTGYYAGLHLQYKIWHCLSIAMLPNLIQKNHIINRTDSLSGIYTKYQNTYLQLPIMLNVTFGRKLKYFLEAGFYTAYWTNSSIDGKIPDIFSVSNNAINQTQEFKLVSYHTRYQFRSIADQRIETGWVGGVGVEYPITAKFVSFLAGRYIYALSNQAKELSNYRYNQTATISLGCKFLWR